MMSDLDRALFVAFRSGIKDRKDNPAADDEQAENYFIFEAFKEGVSHTNLYGTLYDANLRLADVAKWGKIYRDKETSFLLRQS